MAALRRSLPNWARFDYQIAVIRRSSSSSSAVHLNHSYKNKLNFDPSSSHARLFSSSSKCKIITSNDHIRNLSSSSSLQKNQDTGESDGKQFFRLTEDEEQTFADEREFVELNAEMFEELIQTDQDRERLEQVLADYELIKYDTGRVPSTLTMNEMKELLQLETHQLHQKTQMFIYFYKRELGKIRDRQRREERKRTIAERLNEKYEHTKSKTGLEFTDQGVPVYGKWRNTMFVHKSEKSMRTVYEWRAAHSALFGHKMVFDFDFEHEMKKRELVNLGVQMGLVFADNMKSKNPFDLWFCNLKTGSPSEQFVKNNIGHMYERSSLINITDKSYLDLFDKQQLIYLSPNATLVLKEIPAQAIFVIGCIVDRAKIVPLTAGKANSEQVPCYKLPLDDYLFFKGNKVMTVNQVFSIMNCVKEDGNWQRAFDLFVPKRKLKSCEEVKEEQERKIKKFLGKRRLFSSKTNDERDHRKRVEIRSLFDDDQVDKNDRRMINISKAKPNKQTISKRKSNLLS